MTALILNETFNVCAEMAPHQIQNIKITGHSAGHCAHRIIFEAEALMSRSPNTTFGF
jgi:hypothetical protein